MVDAKIAIIGAGAAGLTAGLIAGRHGLSAVLFEARSPGNRAGGIPYIDSFPGLPKLKGTEFVKALVDQVKSYPNVELKEFEQVQSIELLSKENEKGFKLVTGKQEYLFQYVILAMGAEHKHLDVPGEKEFKGRGVSYCAACDGLFFPNKPTVVIGNDTHTVEQALFLNELGSDVTIVNPEAGFEADTKLCTDLRSTPVKVVSDADVREIHGERLVTGVEVMVPEAGGSSKMDVMELEAKGVFISVGLVPKNELVKDIGVVMDEKGHIKVNGSYQTNIPNLYAIGDLTGPDLELVTVCATGAAAVKGIILSKK